MPIIAEGGAAPRIYYRPTTLYAPTTPVPSFDTSALDAEAASLATQLASKQASLAALYKPAAYTAPIQSSLGMPSLSMAGSTMTMAGSTATMERLVADKQAKATGEADANSATGIGNGGLGLASYGVSKSGLSSQKGGSKYGLQDEFWARLQGANRAMTAAGIGSFGITDGWRSLASQVDVKRRKGSLAATPGSSVHGIGYAADLRLSSKQYKWLKAHGSEYGLVNLPGESWHWQQNSRIKRGDAGLSVDAYDVPKQKGSAPFGLRPEAYDAISSANKALAASGLGTIGISSGYRSPTEQRALHKAQPTTSAPVGESTHEQGVSIDVDGTPKQLSWLREHANEHGLVPSSEAWHFQVSPSLIEA